MRLINLFSGFIAASISLVFFSTSLTALADVIATGTLQPAFGDQGLSSLKWGSAELLVSHHVELQDVIDAHGSDPVSQRDQLSEVYDSATSILTQVHRTVTLKVKYHFKADQLRMDIAVTNTSKHPMTDVEVDLLHIQFPQPPKGYDWEHRYSIQCDRVDTFPVILADWGSARLAICSENLDSPINFSLRPMDGQPYLLKLSFKNKPLQADASALATISIRAGGADYPGWSIAHDVLQKYAERYPSTLKWTDRRPIGSAFLATSARNYKTNPRGWFLDPDVDVTTDAGRAAFRDRLMKYDDDVIAHCKTMNAQGVIVWDLEGQEMPHATSYLADCRMLSRVAPEMDSVANAFFKKMRDAGLRVGITVRPTRVGPAPDGHGWAQLDVKDPITEMDQKMTYAQKRWGCTLFYVDSNVDFVRDPNGKILNDPAMAANAFRILSSHHKDCLLMPEHKTDQYYAYTAPYSELRLGVSSTPPEVKEAYPHAFSVMRVVDGPPLDQPETQNELTSAIRSGDILLFRPWWDDPETTKIKQIYDQLATAEPELHK